MPRPPAVSDLLVDADVCARAGSTLERHFHAADLPRLREAGAQDDSQLEVRLRFSVFEDRPAIDGTLSGTIELSCQRCMQPVQVAVEERFQVRVVEAESAEEPGGYEPVIGDAGRLDLRWLAEEQALLALPLVPMHEAGTCGPEAAATLSPDAGEGGQKPFQNLRDMLRQR